MVNAADETTGRRRGPVRRRRIAFEAPIRGGYAMSADIAPSDGEWRVLAIPGAPSRPHMFSRFIARAPDDLDVVAVNRAGYGGPLYGAGRRAPVLSFDEQVAALAPFLTGGAGGEAGGKKTIVVGVSYGGALALKTALDFPGHVAGVVTVAMLADEPRAYVRGAMGLAGWPGLRQVLPGYLHNARAEIAGRRAQIGPLAARLKDLKVPVTVMHGDLDALVPRAAADRVLDWLGPDCDAAFDFVRGGTHYLELQRPDRVYAAIRGVIARAGKVG